MKQVREIGSLVDKTTHLRYRPVCSAKNIDGFVQSVREHRYEEVNISHTSWGEFCIKI